MIVKNMFSAAGVVLFALLTYAFVGQDTAVETLKIGESAPLTDRPMVDVSGEKVTLAEAAGSGGLLVIYNSNTCPFVIGNGAKSEGWEGRYPDLYDLAAQHGIGMVLVNSNAAKRDKGDGFDDMKEQYRREGYKGRYLVDKNHELADAFGALVTPHVFLFDADLKLVYVGAIDDNVDRAQEVKEPYLKNAIKAMASGGSPHPAMTRQLGCSIKRIKV